MRDWEKEEQLLVFADKVFHRVDDRPDDTFPPNVRVDWSDRPAPYRSYPSEPKVRLPLIDLGRAAHGDWRDVSDRIERQPMIEELALLLYLLAGLHRRNLDIDWNSKNPLINFPMQQYRRGTTAGGGLYPVQQYLVIGTGYGLPPGVYHYATAQHALVVLRNGPWAARLAQAVTSSNGSTAHGLYLVLSVDYWQNCFKYHNFGYHVCGEDVGAMLATTHLVADAVSLEHQNFIEFDDMIANEVIGVDGGGESVFAIVGLGPMMQLNPENRLQKGDAPPSAVAKPCQISRRVSIAPEFVRVHRLSHISRASLTNEVPRVSIRDRVPPMNLATLLHAMTHKQSAWGSMWTGSPMEEGNLHSLLEFMTSKNASPDGELAEAFSEGGIGICVQALDVSGLPQGAYRWDQPSTTLRPLQSTPPRSWQQTYHMKNYNIDETACIVFVTGDIRQMLARYGVRGYRTLNAYVGMLAQLGYVGAAHLRLDCGVALGVSAQRVKKILHLPDTEDVILAIYLSKGMDHYRLFDFLLEPCV